jgi:type IV secretory pathway VirB2 component (pilin)
MKTQTQDPSLMWQISLLTVFCAAILVMPSMTYAADGSPIGQVLCNVVGWFLGTTGKGLATLAIIIIGVGALMGKVSWGMAIIVGIGVATIFGAATLVNNLGTDNGGGCVSDPLLA